MTREKQSLAPLPASDDIRAMRAIAALIVLSAACNVFPTRKPAPLPAAAVASRPLPYPVFESHAFANAVARGTRTRTGEPGREYWQQFAQYHIDAELVPTTSQVNGRETVRYF